MLNEDYKDILQLFTDNGVEYLVVGAYALGAYGLPRATGDIDLWVLADAENSRKIYYCLAKFGAPMEQIDEQTFTRKDVIFQIGIAPRRIDIITKISGVDFQEAYSRRKEVVIDNIKVPFISMQDLITNKEASGRDKDKLDARHLRKKKATGEE
jgi:predicted nucleotidyltransferase